MARLIPLTVVLAVFAAACANSRPRDEGATFPPALQGCWKLEQAPDDEYPDGLSSVLIVSAEGLTIASRGVGRRRGKIEIVEHMSSTHFEGRITSFEGETPVTIATELKIEDGAAATKLLLREGDAGSYVYRRCSSRSDEPSDGPQR